MTSIPTALLGLEKQGEHDNTNTWWTNANQFLDAIDDAIAGAHVLSTTGGDTTLTVASYLTTDKARLAIVRINSGGSPITSNIRIIAGRKREYLVSNETTSGAFTVSFGFDVSNQVTIPRGSCCRIHNRADGTSVRVGPAMVLSTGLLDTATIPPVTNAMLDTTLAAQIAQAIADSATALSTANTANSTANTAQTTANGIIPGGGVNITTWFQASAPTNWTKLTSHDNKSLRIVSGSGGGSGGSVNFDTVFARTATDGHALSIGEMPSHDHTYTRPHPIDGSGVHPTGSGRGDPTTVTASTTSATGSGTAHTHDIDLRVKYVDLILCSKN